MRIDLDADTYNSSLIKILETLSHNHLLTIKYESTCHTLQELIQIVLIDSKGNLDNTKTNGQSYHSQHATYIWTRQLFNAQETKGI